MAKSKKQKRKLGRPPKPMPESIPDTPENIASAILGTPPKKEDDWRYLRDHREREVDLMPPPGGA